MWIEATAIKIRLLVDNYIDVFEPSTPLVRRVTPGEAKRPLMAGHGYSLFIEVEGPQGYRNLLVDSSHSSDLLLHNMGALGINPGSVERAFLTHGHVDHFGGLAGFMKAREREINIYTHPDSFYPKLVVTPRGKVGPWQLNREELEHSGARFILNREPTVIGDYFLLSGEVPRTTPFEKPWPAAKVIKDGEEALDTFSDEQTLIMKVKNVGLIVVAGCSHPGIINMIEHARELGREKLHTLVGGFHLGVASEEALMGTVSHLKDSELRLVVPCHCTGFKATKLLSEVLGDRFAVNCVGSLIGISA